MQVFSKFLLLALAASLTGVASAQWTNNAATRMVVADAGGEQVQPKTRPTQDGGCYISWFDNRVGGYDVYLQRLDARGNEQWAHNGILIADRGYSSTVDYDMTVDADGNALLAFNDDRPGSDQVTVTKVNPAGTQVWGSSGVVVSVGTVFKGNPKVAALSDGNIMVGWSESPGFKLQKVNSSGLPVGGTQTISEAGRTISLSDMHASDNASFICLWIRPFNTNFLSSKYLYSQKYDSSYNALWPVTGSATAVVVYGPTGAPYGSQGGSVQNGYFPTFIPDGHGGAVYGWYENAGPRNAYVQHVLANGHQKFALNGVSNASTPTSRMRIGGALAYSRWGNEYFLASPESDVSPQANYRVFVQKITGAGARAWGNTGTTIIATNPSNQPSFISCELAGSGCSVFGFDSRSVTTGIVFGAGVDNAGVGLWGTSSPTYVDSVIDSKSRLSTGVSYGGFHLLTWGSAPTGSVDIWANRMNFDGSLGNKANVITGNVTLLDWDGDIQSVPVVIELRQGGVTAETHVVRLTATGDFRFDTDLSGTYDIEASAPHWLRKNLGSVATGGGASGLTGSLTNGDVDGDGEVAIGDYAVLSAAFGSTPIDPTWSENADLNGDEGVDIGDYAILSANFGQVADN